MYLKPLYSDVSFDDLTSTLNRLHNKNFRPEDIEAYYMYMCNEISQKKLRNAGIHQPSPSNMMELDGPLLPLKDTAFHGEENYLHYNRPIITLVGHRRKYEAALTVLKKSSSPDAAVSLPERPADVERLSKPGPVAVEDLRDLRPSDLERIYQMRQKTRGPMLSYWRQERWGGLED
ncbi:MAG: hypothetical protein L6R42_011433 [Xanthoria sp. 1 TBL-2021]|nr:MAG: hypothetical protein L6R42_011433 [Xanthoria sp. 1 TBL-2021]